MANNISKNEEGSSSSYSTISSSNKDEPSRKKLKYEKIFDETKSILNDYNDVKIQVDQIEKTPFNKYIRLVTNLINFTSTISCCCGFEWLCPKPLTVVSK